MPAPTPPDAVLDVVRRHLATATSPDDAVAHLATYGEDALLPIGTAVVRRAGLDPAKYADHWRSTLGGATDLRLGGALTAGDVLAWAPDAEGGQLALTVRDAHGRTWTTAWLLDGDPPRIRAVTTITGPLPGRDRLLAEACGDLLQWSANTAGTWRFLSPLGISLHLRAAYDGLPLVSLPEARFTCQGRGDCCHLRHWDAAISVNVAVALDAMPWQGLGVDAVRVERSDKGYLKLATNDAGACFALEGTRCGVHRALGHQPIPVCQGYPYQFARTPDSVDVTAAFSCLTVGNNQGEPLLARPADVANRLRLYGDGITIISDPVRLWPGGPPLTWSSYRALETVLLATLADRSLGDLAARVFACSRGMAALTEVALAERGTPADPVAVVQAGMHRPRTVSPLAADLLMDRVLRDRPWEPAALRPFGGWLRQHWSLSRSGRLGTDRDDELATRYLRTVLFRKAGLEAGGVVFAWGLTAWAACLWDRQTLYQHRRDRRPIDRELQLDTARRLDLILLNANLPDWLVSEPSLRQMISNPATWLALSAASG